MSLIDINKLKSILEKSGIIIIDYYTLDDKCAMLKTFIYNVNQFLLIYIPSKLRSDIKNKKDIYELKSLDEVVDEEDYAKFDEYQINQVQQQTHKDSYKQLANKYNKQIVINGDGIEKYEKRITRQIKRINIPFSKLDYKLGIQNKKILALYFGDEVSLFYIKNFTKDIRCYMYIINVKDLIDNITEVQYEIGNINKQFYNILSDIIETNLKELSKDYINIIEKFKKQQLEYNKNLEIFNNFIKKINNEEISEVKKYKELFLKETSTIRKNTLESEYQKIVNSYLQKKIEKIENIINQTYIFHIYFLLLEEISFDNYIMIKRTELNFSKLKELFN